MFKEENEKTVSVRQSRKNRRRDRSQKENKYRRSYSPGYRIETIKLLKTYAKEDINGQIMDTFDELANCQNIETFLLHYYTDFSFGKEKEALSDEEDYKIMSDKI
ncbi:hypothetical protein M0812_28872 [Anaeramoeba flamelloides]|uniref:Uncharacterized protein n=1 Tax=Anaeramoeba flamelloides TaxID=1746091 RepID=A0AAV7YCZ3_9EUKA|nr:hypothetical protein M0812_28872 [Anaeramoeba flamelloides]